MEKIIRELLEQYEKDMDMPQFAVQYYTDEYIISKHYGFIKWLVDNDKIDMRKAKYYSDYIHDENYGEGGWTCNDYEFVLMLLAIQDEPIEFLCSILK